MKKPLLLNLVFFFFMALSSPLWAQEGELNLEEPQLAPQKEQGPSLGPLSNINFGGTLDLRYYAPSNEPNIFAIHVAELFVTANVGDNVTLLIEQLLATSSTMSPIGDDHGFAYAIISNIPFLPEGSALKVGRFRFNYGIDAVSDAAANPVQTLVKKNLGFIADKGINWSGYVGDLDYSLSLLNGPDILNGMAYTSPNKPFAGRLSTDLFNKQLKVGLSYFEGDSYPFTNGFQALGEPPINGVLDKTRLVHKKRGSADVRFRLGNTDFAGEYTTGEDDNLAGAKNTVAGWYVRADYPLIANKLILLAQADQWQDGIAATVDATFYSAGLTYNLSDTSFMRLTYTTPFDSRYDGILAGQLLFAY